MHPLLLPCPPSAGPQPKRCNRIQLRSDRRHVFHWRVWKDDRFQGDWIDCGRGGQRTSRHCRVQHSAPSRKAGWRRKSSGNIGKHYRLEVGEILELRSSRAASIGAHGDQSRGIKINPRLSPCEISLSRGRRWQRGGGGGTTTALTTLPRLQVKHSLWRSGA